MYNIEDIKNTIIQGDCVKELRTIPDNSIDCIITSPPYNKGYFGKRTASKHDVWKQRNIDYGSFKDNIEWEVYKKQQTELLTELVRIVTPTGSIFYNHKGQPHKHRLYFPDWIFHFNLRQIIIWDRGSTLSLYPIRWLPTTEYIFWITKTNIQPKFKRVGEFKSEVWRIPPRPMKEHPAPFPEKLVYECMINTTDANDIVLDPYMGSGTTAVVAKKLGRHYIGIELNPDYIKLAKARLKQIQPKLL